MATLKPIPFLSSRDSGFSNWIEELRGHSLGKEKKRVLRYLLSATCLVGIPLIERDPFQDNSLIQDPRNIFCDGKWIWIGTIAHWVRTVDLALPNDFLTTVRTHRFIPPSVDPDQIECVWRDNPEFFSP